MKKLLCIFTLLALVSATVYAESKKDTKADFVNFTEEQVQNISNSALADNSILAQELKTLLNEEATKLEENATSPQNPAFKQTRLKTFFDTDSHGVKKYAETSTALLETYNRKCNAGSITSTDYINWDVEKISSSTYITVTSYNDLLFFNEYDFSLECPNGAVYIAHKICFTTVTKHTARESEAPVFQYVDCNLYESNIIDR